MREASRTYKLKKIVKYAISICERKLRRFYVCNITLSHFLGIIRFNFQNIYYLVLADYEPLAIGVSFSVVLFLV